MYMLSRRGFHISLCVLISIIYTRYRDVVYTTPSFIDVVMTLSFHNSFIYIRFRDVCPHQWCSHIETHLMGILQCCGILETIFSRLASLSCCELDENYSKVISEKAQSTFIAFNSLKPRQNGRHFPDDIFKWIFLNENVWISINISLKFDLWGPINNIPTLVQVMAWRRPGDKPLSEPMMVRVPTHICVTRPQWVKVTMIAYSSITSDTSNRFNRCSQKWKSLANHPTRDQKIVFHGNSCIILYIYSDFWQCSSSSLVLIWLL